jgi:phosphatidylserine/phosphatidylglycerophosphate/cardiolipin synthase-like enzyme
MLIINEAINSSLKSEYQAAKKSIDIIMYSASRPRKGSSKLFIDTWQSLQVAIKGGINCRVILEQWPAQNPQFMEQLKVKTLLETWGAKVRFAKKGHIMHSKTWLFDRKKLIIGSHNSTEAGLCRTKNLSVVVHEPTICDDYAVYFDNEWQSIEKQV